MTAQKKKILIIEASPRFHPLNRFSAIASVLYSLGELLQNNDYEVSINQYSLDSLVKKSKSGETQVIKSASRVGITRYLPVKVKEGIKDALLLFRLWRAEKAYKYLAQKPDVIIEFLTYGSTIGLNLAKQWNVPFLAIYDAPQLEQYEYLNGFEPIFKNIIEDRELHSVRDANAVIVYSEEISDRLKSKIGPYQTFYYHQFSDFKRLDFIQEKADAPPLNVAYIGSFLKWHRIETLINVYDRLRAEGLELNLYLVGEGLEYLPMKTLADATKYGKEIIFTGYADGKKLQELTQKIHVGIIPNAMWFHAPVKLFQYSAAKMALLAADTPTIAYITRENEGVLLFDNENPENLYKQLKYLATNPDKIQYYATLGQQHIYNKYNPDAVFRKMHGILNSLPTTNH
jgi:glycosyltransferase involved in cell wall biosynthesis